VPGGEYGLGSDMPHGANAMDLQLFVDDLGFTPMEAICAATRDAAHLMAMERELGTLEPGKLADLLVVDGDPLRDITVLQQKERITLVMKDGEIHARNGKLLPL
jgi:imidazolonepropionase-like amidohydrolase